MKKEKKKLPRPSAIHFEALGVRPSKADEKRSRILEAVIEILAHRGVDELTFESVGKATGLARSHVLYYFAERNDLVVAGIRFSAMSAGKIIDEHVAKSRGWKDRIAAYVEGNFNWIESFPSHANVYTLLYYLGSYRPDYQQIHSEIRATGESRIRAILEDGLLELSTLELKKLTKSIQALITGNLIDIMTTNQRPHLRARCRQTIEIVNSLIDRVDHA